jgi:hypothetical protein
MHGTMNIKFIASSFIQHPDIRLCTVHAELLTATLNKPVINKKSPYCHSAHFNILPPYKNMFHVAAILPSLQPLPSPRMSHVERLQGPLLLKYLSE